MGTYYNTIASSYDALHKEEQLQKLAIIKKRLKIDDSMKLLDVGCGTAFAKDYFDCEYYGIDPAEKLLKQNYLALINKRLFVASAEKIPFDDDSFDIIISVTSLQNFDDVAKALIEMKRVAKETCQFALSFLKKANNAKEIEKEIIGKFAILERIEEKKDIILFCKK